MPRNLNFCFNMIKSPPSPEHPPLNTNRPFPFKTFNSLYDPSTTAAETSGPDELHSSAAPPPDLEAAFASRRFFCSSPGRSNSIVDSTSSFASTSLSSAASATSASSSSAQNDAAVSAVPKYSPDPYVDFRLSMKEMVDAGELHDGRESWDYLHELLVCYLSLNPKSTHKFIIAAFADVVVGMMTSSSPEEGSPGDHRRAEDFPAVDLCINY